MPPKQLPFRNDQKRLSTQIVNLTKDEVFGISRKALADLATVSLEERMGEVFTRRLREMDPKSKAAMGASLEDKFRPSYHPQYLSLCLTTKRPLSRTLSTKRSHLR